MVYSIWAINDSPTVTDKRKLLVWFLFWRATHMFSKSNQEFLWLVDESWRHYMCEWRLMSFILRSDNHQCNDTAAMKTNNNPAKDLLVFTCHKIHICFNWSIALNYTETSREISHSLMKRSAALKLRRQKNRFYLISSFVTITSDHSKHI